MMVDVGIKGDVTSESDGVVHGGNGQILLGRGQFSDLGLQVPPVHFRLGRALNVAVWLKIVEPTPGNSQTILDFSHSPVEGAVLEYQQWSGNTLGALSWFVGGSAVVEPVFPGVWFFVMAGYDPKTGSAWLSVDEGQAKKIIPFGTPFPNDEVALGIGGWLESPERNFIGEIADLTVDTNAYKTLVSLEDRRQDLINRPPDIVVESRLKRKFKDSSQFGFFSLFKGLVNGKKAMDNSKLGERVLFGGAVGRTLIGIKSSPLGMLIGEVGDGDTLSELLRKRRRCSDFDATLAQFIEFVVKEDPIGAAWFLQKIFGLGYTVSVKDFRGVWFEMRFEKGPGKFSNLSRNLLETDVRKMSGTATWALLASGVACAQAMFKEDGARATSSWMSDLAKSHGTHHVFTDIDMAQSTYAGQGEESHVLVKNLALGGLDYFEYFRGHDCFHPFKDFEIRSDGEVFVCCPSYLPHSIGNVYQMDSVQDIRDSERGKKIRSSIVRQDYRYCRWLHCRYIMETMSDRNKEAATECRPAGKNRDKFWNKAVPTTAELLKRDSVIDVQVVEDSIGDSSITPVDSEYKPEFFRLSYDPTCNLWCPSCRVEKIVAKGQQRTDILKITGDLVLPLLKTAKTCMMNGYGDVFASKACRKILNAVNRADYPDLKFEFITNGVLFTEDEWNKFPGIHNEMVRVVRVSMDAATKETYDKIRLGGDWEILMKNLNFISRLRQEDIIGAFMISFVIQDSNFHEMSKFAELGKKLGCDVVVFEPIMDWNTFSRDEFKDKAVHFGENQLNEAFLREVDSLNKILPDMPNIDLALVGTPGYERTYKALTYPQRN